MIPFIRRLFEIDPLQNLPETKTYLPYILSVFFYCVVAVILFGHGLFNGEMWAEAGKIYFRNASGTLSQLFVRDSGYLVWPQQFIVFAAHILPIPTRFIPYFYNAAATFLTGLMVFSFTLPRFRVLFASDKFRLVICILIAMVGGIETRQFINFTYYSAFFMTVTMAMMMIAKPSKMPWYVWTFPIFCLGKPAILGLFPIMLISLFLASANFRRVIWLSFAAISAQLINVASVFGHIEGNSYPATERALIMLYHIRAQINALWTPDIFNGLPLLQYLLFIATLSGLLYLCYHWRHPAKRLLLFGLILIGGSNFIVSFGLKGSQFMDWTSYINYIEVYRWTTIQIFGIILIISGLCQKLSEKFEHKKWYKSAIFFLILWVAFSSWHSKLSNRIEPPDTEWHTQSWQEITENSPAQTPCTAIQPVGWVYGEGRTCRLEGLRKIDKFTQSISNNTPILLSKPKRIGDRHVQAIVLVYQVDKNTPDYALTLKLNDQVITKSIKGSTYARKNMVVQFNLPKKIPGSLIQTASMQASVPIKISPDTDRSPYSAHAHWYVDLEQAHASN